MSIKSCSRLLYKITKKEITNSEKPFQVTLHYKRLNPHTPKSSASGISFGFPIFHFMDITIPQISFTKQRVMENPMTQSEINELERTILVDGFCFKCGNTSNCAKLKFTDQ